MALEVFMAKKRDSWVVPDFERFLPDLGSPDEEARGDAVRGLCPCHVGWKAFEDHVGDVLKMLRDPSRGVRAQALHVFDDATRMQFAEELNYYHEEGEERIGERRARGFRSIAERLEARRDRRARKNKGRHWRFAG